jgi:ferrochelatase
MITGVILLNLGGPDSLQAVRPFLYNLFSDRQIIRLGPPFMQKPLAWLISTLRSKKTENMYSQIGGKSPIFDITKAQAKALEEALNKGSNPPFPKGGQGGITNPSQSFKVYIGMRYWRPFAEDVVAEIFRDGIRKLVGLSLYPQYSVTTSGSSLSQFREVSSRYDMEIFTADSWHNHPLYIEALVDVIKKGLESFDRESNPPLPPFSKGGRGGITQSSPDIHVLFSAHSLPQKIIDQGDPYVNQTLETIREIEKHLPIRWHLSYQSKSGPVKWLEPSTDDKLGELARDGIKNVLVVPISFVSDHIETLYEIDILYKNLAGKLHINLKRTEALNTHPKFIRALQDIVEKSLEDSGENKSTGLP